MCKGYFIEESIGRTFCTGRSHQGINPEINLVYMAGCLTTLLPFGLLNLPNSFYTKVLVSNPV